MNQRGQSLVITILFLTVLAGMSAIVLDFGAWYRADRKLQANADAAALAGAQELPASTGAATAMAVDYANTNDGGVEAGNVKFRRTVVDNDTIEVTAERPSPGFFTKLFGRDSVMVRARAVAQVGTPSSARWAAPIAVDERHPMLQCKCYGASYPTDIDFVKTGPGAFRLINIDSSYGGTSSATIGDWIRSGLDAWMDKDKWYYSDPGMKPDSSHVRGALTARDETELLLPVYRSTRAQGAGFEYYVVGWAVFHVTDWDIHGAKDSRISGYFMDMIWEGINSEHAGDPNFGARSVQLIE